MSSSFMPNPPERLNNIDKFSTFLVLDNRQAGTVLQWKTQASLRRNLGLYQKNNPQFAELCYQKDQEIGIVRFWLNLAVNNDPPAQDWEPANRKLLALEHLAAYLDKTCYWAAKDVCKNSSDRSWQEYFDIARASIHNTDKFTKHLKTYNPAQGASLATFIKGVLINNIRDQAKIGKFSPWRLLAENTDKELREALQQTGRREPNISLYLFARKYFKKVYRINRTQNPTFLPGQKWLEPTPEDLDEVAKLYNAEKLLPAAPHEVFASGITVTGVTIKEWMKICIEALKDYSKPIHETYVESLIQSQDEEELNNSNQSDESEYKISNKSDSSDDPKQLIYDAQTKENNHAITYRKDAAFREEIESIQARVEKGIKQGKLQYLHKKIPLLYYGIGFKQKLLEDKLSINQSNINRHLSSYYETPLLNKLVAISQATEWVKPYVSRWLIKDYTAPLYSDLIQAALVEALGKLSSEYREVLQLRFGQRLTEQQISQRLSLAESEVEQRIQKAQTCLESDLIKVIEKWCKKEVRGWLDKFYQSEVYSFLQAASTNLTNELQELVKYRYKLRRTEAQTAIQLNWQEHQVTENIYLLKIQLQNALVKWLETDLHIILEKEAEFSIIARVVEEWLDNLYK